MPRDEVDLETLQSLYLNSLVWGNETAATAALDEGLQAGYSPTRLYLEVLAPAQVQIGELWHQGKLNVGQEHLATQITLAQMYRLRSQFPLAPQIGVRVVITTGEGEPHFLGARMVADFFLASGWKVDFLGPETPADDLVEFVRQHRPELVSLSLTLPDQAAQVAHTVEALKALPDSPKVLLGGQAVIRQPELVSAIGANGWATDPLAGLREARRLLGLSRGRPSLEHYLALLGKRVQYLRRQRGWNQQQLAQAADLDRTYISAVENGRQNLTLGAVVKLAEALGVDLSQLLAGGDNH